MYPWWYSSWHLVSPSFKSEDYRIILETGWSKPSTLFIILENLGKEFFLTKILNGCK